MRLWQIKTFTSVTTCAGIALLWLAWQTLNSPLPDLQARPIADPPTQSKAPQATEAPEQALPLTAVLERPLFRPDRRPFTVPIVEPVVVPTPPPEPPPQEPPPPPPPPQMEAVAAPVFPQIALRGIRLTGQIDAALLETPDFPQGKWSSVGTEFLGWRITLIEKDKVTFTSGETIHTLQLYVDNPTNAIGNPPQGP
jgi:hypothetical protein